MRQANPNPAVSHCPIMKSKILRVVDLSVIVSLFGWTLP